MNVWKLLESNNDVNLVFSENNISAVIIIILLWKIITNWLVQVGYLGLVRDSNIGSYIWLKFAWEESSSILNINFNLLSKVLLTIFYI